MHTTYLLKRYLCVAILTMIGLAALRLALELVVDVQIGSALGIVTAIVPALDAGQTYGRRWEKRPENLYAWRMAAAFVALNFAAGLVLVLLTLSVTGGLGAFFDIVVSLGSLAMLGIMLVIFAIYLAASRYFFGYGAKLALKVAQEEAGKNQP
ncbi:MAG: ABZJ_00895 family protein [Pseudomonadota bacterium]